MNNITAQYNEIFGIRDSYEAPSRVLQLLTESSKVDRNDCFYRLAKVNNFDFAKDWFWEYFQDEHADRKQNKQDFTPPSITKIVHSILRATHLEKTSLVYEPAAGTGQMIIGDWEQQRTRQMPWEYKPSEHLYVCSEYSVKTIPFLLFNLAVRGIVAVVYHIDTLRKEIEAIYKLDNPQDSTICYSEVTKLDKESSEYMYLSALMVGE